MVCAKSGVERVTGGWSFPPRYAIRTESADATAGYGLTSGRVYGTGFWAPEDMTVAAVGMTARVARTGTPTLVQMGLATLLPTGAFQTLATTANDTALFASNNTNYVRALSTPAPIVCGSRYYVLVLMVGATARLAGTAIGAGLEGIPAAFSPTVLWPATSALMLGTDTSIPATRQVEPVAGKQAFAVVYSTMPT